MKAVDSNVLVYAEITSSPHHTTALGLLRDLAEGPAPWAIPWPCVYEFLRVVTHPKVFHPPVPLEQALADLRRILASPSLVLLYETERHSEVLLRLLEASQVTANLIFDAHIATLCIEHGVEALITGDRDFQLFPELAVEDPFRRR